LPASLFLLYNGMAGRMASTQAIHSDEERRVRAMLNMLEVRVRAYLVEVDHS